MLSLEFTELWDDQNDFEDLPDPLVTTAKDAIILALHSHATASGLSLHEVYDAIASFVYTQNKAFPQFRDELDVATKGMEDASRFLRSLEDN